MSFWQAYSLWRDPLVADMVAATACAALGVFLVLRRLSFVAATVTQAAGVGVTLALLGGTALGVATDHSHSSPVWLDPTLWGFVVATLTGVPLGLRRPKPDMPADAIIALAYVVAWALTVLLAAKIGQELNHVQSVLLGSAVAVEPRVLAVVIAVGVVTVVTLLLLGRRLVFASFDREVATVAGLPVRTLDVVLLGLVGLGASAFTRAVGALPVFGFFVLPASAALLGRRGLRATFLLSLGIAAVGTFAGFYLSFRFDLPAGATIVVTLAGITLVSATAGRLWYGNGKEEAARSPERS